MSYTFLFFFSFCVLSLFMFGDLFSEPLGWFGLLLFLFVCRGKESWEGEKEDKRHPRLRTSERATIPLPCLIEASVFSLEFAN